MTSLTFIAPDGRLYTHKKYVNWEGVREVEGVERTSDYGKSNTAESVCRALLPTGKPLYAHVDFTIQD